MTLTKIQLTPSQTKELARQYTTLYVDSMDYKTMERIVEDMVYDDVKDYDSVTLVSRIRDEFGDETLEDLLGGAHHGE